MNKLAYLLIAPALMFACGGAQSDADETIVDTTAQEVAEVEIETEEETPKPPKSPRRQSNGMINGVEVVIDYGSPYVKERSIWGELVPYDKIWRAGANEATSITFGDDVKINGSDVAAGTYALFILPKADAEWTIILNEEWSKELHGVWGAYDHKPEKDVLRFDVIPVFGEDNLESLTYTINEQGVSFAWENASFEFAIDTK